MTKKISSFVGMKISPKEEKALDENMQQIEDIDTLDKIQQAKLKRYEQNTEYRKRLTEWVMNVSSLWLFGIFLILCFNNTYLINISDTVIIALLGSATANVLGLAAIVLKGMFGNNKR